MRRKTPCRLGVGLPFAQTPSLARKKWQVPRLWDCCPDRARKRWSRLMVEGKAVVVTGAGGGIGRAIALAMAQHAARVVVNDIGAAVDGAGRDAGAAQQEVDEIRALGGHAAANTDNLPDPPNATP